MKSENFCSWEYLEEDGVFLVAHLWVSPGDRGQGIGRKLLEEAIKEMREDGRAEEVQLSADSELEDPESPIELADLVEFYESAGFEVTYAGEIVAMSMML